MTRPPAKVPSAKDAEAPAPTRTFVSVLVIEAVIIVLLWLFGRAYS